MYQPPSDPQQPQQPMPMPMPMQPPTQPAPGYPPSNYPPQPVRRGLAAWPLWLKIAAPIAAILVLCSVCSACAFGIGLLGSSGAPSTSAAPTATSFTPATPRPTATATPDTRVANYRDYVTGNTTAMSADFSGIGDNCGTGHTLSACRKALVQAHTDIVAFQNGLQKHPAPPCLASADTMLRAALTDYEQGTQLNIDGIDQLDADKIQQGGALLDLGNTKMGQATDAVLGATC